MKIGIVTFHGSHNYGSVLQAYALLNTLIKLGHDAVIIDFRHPVCKQMYEFTLWSKDRSVRGNISNLIRKGILRQGRKRMRLFHDFIEKELHKTKRYYSSYEIMENFDCLVCGSDQIWNPEAADSHDPIYKLDFGGEDVIRFSYAASSGSQKFLKCEVPHIKDLLSKFVGIGVREQFMKDYLHKELGLEATVNPDPTLLLETQDWESVEDPYPSLPAKYLLVYSLLNMPATLKFARVIADSLGLPLVHINPSLNSKRFIDKNADLSLFDVSPGNFLWLFKNATFVVSNSFHGNMFSVIYRKDFVYPISEFCDTRILTLHERIGLGTSRMFVNANDFDLNNTHIDYQDKESNIATFRAEGVNFIKECLNKY